MPNYLRKRTNFKIRAKKFSFLCTKWEDSTLTHFSDSFQVNMYLCRQQLLYLLIFMYSLLYLLYMFSPIFMWSAALNKPGSVITQGMGGRGGGGGWQQADEQLNFEWSRQKLLAGKEKENSQIFYEDFYLPLYLPLCEQARKIGQFSLILASLPAADI